MSSEYKTLKIKVIAVDNKEKPLLTLLMTVKLIVTLIEFRVLFTWEEEERGFNIMESGKVKIMLIIDQLCIHLNTSF